jgi:hypothetical protein
MSDHPSLLLRRNTLKCIGCRSNQTIKSRRFGVPALWALLIASSVTMLWLLWRFPIPTSVGAIALLATLFHCVHLADFMDLAAPARSDKLSDHAINFTLGLT